MTAVAVRLVVTRPAPPAEVEFDGMVYRLRRRSPAPPDLNRVSRAVALAWIAQHARATGKPPELHGFVLPAWFLPRQAPERVR